MIIVFHILVLNKNKTIDQRQIAKDYGVIKVSIEMHLEYLKAFGCLHLLAIYAI